METLYGFHRFAAALGCANVFLTHLWTGRILRDDKRGAIHQNTPPILKRLDLNPKNWIESTRNFESSFKSFVSSIDKVKQSCASLGYKRLPNIGALLT